MDSRRVGPMGLLELPLSEANDPRIATFKKHGIISELCQMDIENIIPHGVMLLKRFDDQGAKGTIVLSRTYAHGDMFLAASVISALKKRYPENDIIFHTMPKMEPLIRHHPDAKIITGDEALKDALRLAGVYINLDDVAELYEEHNPGSGMNRIEIFCHHLGLEPETLCPNYYITPEEIDSADTLLRHHQRPYIGISPSTMRKEKSWPLERWEVFTQAIQEQTGGTVFVYDDKPVLNVEGDHVAKLIHKPFRTVGSIAYHMDIFVTQDSLWSHWAAALGVKQILLSSCTDGALLAKGYPKVSVIQRDWECSPCWYKFDNPACLHGGYPACLQDVSENEVVTKVLEVL